MVSPEFLDIVAGRIAPRLGDTPPADAPRWLVVGGSGTLGRSIVRRYAAHYQVLPDAPPHAKLDATHEASIRAWLSTHRPYDTVILSAAFTDVDRAESERLAAWRLNAVAPGLWAAALAPTNTHLIVLSTDFVFDGREEKAHREDDPPSPLGWYGHTKRLGEIAALNLAGPGGVTVVRTGRLWNPDLGAFFGQVVAKARAREPIRLLCDQWGKPTCTVDLAGWLAAIATQRPGGIIHAVGGGAPATWRDLGREIYAALGADPALVKALTTAELNRPAPRPRYSVLDTARLTHLCGAPPRDWREAVQEFLALPAPPCSP